MTLEEVVNRVAEIHENVEDYETAHAMRYKLYKDVLRDLSSYNMVPLFLRNRIKVVLEADKIEFPQVIE